MLNLVPFDFIQPSKLLLGLDAYDYVAVGPTGEVLGRGRVKELVLNTPGIYGYFNLKEASPIDVAKNAPPNFDDKPWGSVGEVQTVPGWPLIEPVKINRPDLVEDKDGKIEAAVNEFKAARSKKTKAKKAK
jgi:hypothetical protein